MMQEEVAVRGIHMGKCEASQKIEASISTISPAAKLTFMFYLMKQIVHQSL